jgi:hypothetical protein
LDTEWKRLFNRVLIKDSTKFDLSESMMKEMPGFGGGASLSGACIQFEFDIKRGRVIVLHINLANVPDNNKRSLDIDSLKQAIFSSGIWDTSSYPISLI